MHISVLEINRENISTLQDKLMHFSYNKHHKGRYVHVEIELIEYFCKPSVCLGTINTFESKQVPPDDGLMVSLTNSSFIFWITGWLAAAAKMLNYLKL